jgi:competence protein ComEA
MTHHLRLVGVFLVMALALGAVLPPVAAAPAAAPASPAGEKINVNTASAEELVALPGIGMAYAQRIVEYREKNGPFRKVDDLLNVRGIGEKTLERIRDRVTVGGK